MVLALLVLAGGRAAGAPAAGGPAPSLVVVASELSPAVLVYTLRPRLTLFGGLEHWGLGAPSHLAWRGANGLQVARRAPGQIIRLPGQALAEGWMLVWWAGAPGWSAWDSPWLVVWQRRPSAVVLDTGGLHAEGAGGLGYVALMPLYGIAKPPTSLWKTLSARTARDCRFWARVLRRYPLACDETFRIEPATRSVAVRDRFRWLAIPDDWHTPPLRLAPLAPTLALAHRDGRMPLVLSAPVFDPQMVTSFGPYVGVLNTDGYEVRFPVLPYITQTEEDQTPDQSDPVVDTALTRLRRVMGDAFSAPDGLFHQDFGDPPGFAQPPGRQGGDSGNSCYAFVSTQYPCRALPYLEEAVAVRARIRLHRYFADWVLQPQRFQPFRGELLLAGPGIGTWGGYDDAGKFSSNVLVTLWAYAHATGDWALIRERWPLIRQLFITPRECSWRGCGRDAIAEMGDEAAPALAMARLAWFAGDKETFAYAAYIFARELTHHVVKHTGAAYFRAHQPVHNAEPIPPNVFLTNLLGDVAGWQWDGPTYPAHTGDRQYTNRWVRFGDPDVARFHRDYLRSLDQREMDDLLRSGRFTGNGPNVKDTAHILPSLVRLRSLLLNETPAELARITPPDAPTNSRDADAAYCVAFLRVSRPPRTAMLIPPGRTATEWATGIARDRPEDQPFLSVVVSSGAAGGTGAPALTWWGWRPPRPDPAVPGGDRWSFGQILTDRPPTAGRAAPLSWNTRAITFP